MSRTYWHHGIAVIVVVALHGVMIWLLYQPPSPSLTVKPHTSDLRLRWWPRPPVLPPSVPAPPSPAQAPRLSASRLNMPRPERSTPLPHASEDAAVATPSPLPPAHSASEWLAQGAAWAQAGRPAPDFGADPLRRRRVRLPGSEKPGRFVMRPANSPQQIVAFIGQLFAGAHYSTDPCVQIRSNVNGLLTDLSDSGRERLAWELDEYEFRCMR